MGRAEIPKCEAFAVGSIRVDEMNNYGVQAEGSWNWGREYEDCMAEEEHVVQGTGGHSEILMLL